MSKRTAIYERSPESHWHWSWLFTCRKQTHFIVHKFNFFFPPVKAHLIEPLAVLLQAASLWYMPLSDSSYFSEAPTNSSVPVSLTGCCCCRCKQTVIWDTQSFYRAFCTPQHVVCACSVPHFTAGLCPCHCLVSQLLHPEISSMFSYQTFARIYCFNIQRYCHLWSATGLDEKSSQNHK